MERSLPSRSRSRPRAFQSSTATTRGEPRSEIRDQRPRYALPRDAYTDARQPARFRTRRQNTIHGANYCVFCERTPSGRIRRNAAARQAFRELASGPATGLSAGRAIKCESEQPVTLCKG